LRMPLPKKQIRYVGKASCYQCGLDCLRGLFRTTSGNEAVMKCHPMVFYMFRVAQRPGETMDTAMDAARLCNDFSLCTMEIDNIMTWLESCYRSGFLTEKETGLEISKIGSLEFIEQLISKIAQREGFGDILAEGLLRAGNALGEKAREHFTEDMYGLGLGSAYSPREYVTNAMLYALEPRQPMAMLHEVSYLIARWLLHLIKPELSPTSSEVFRAAAKKFWGGEMAWDMTTFEGKAIAAVKIQDRTCVKDSLVLCDCAWPIMDSFNTRDHVGDPTLESKLFTAVTGIETSETDLHKYGERIFNLQRGILLREGWKAKEADVPAEFNFTVPLENDLLNPHLIVPGSGDAPVSLKGNILDREKFTKMREEFYGLRRWDTETGLQTRAGLEAIGLGDMVLYLEREGLVA